MEGFFHRHCADPTEDFKNDFPTLYPKYLNNQHTNAMITGG